METVCNCLLAWSRVVAGLPVPHKIRSEQSKTKIGAKHYWFIADRMFGLLELHLPACIRCLRLLGQRVLSQTRRLSKLPFPRNSGSSQLSSRF